MATQGPKAPGIQPEAASPNLAAFLENFVDLVPRFARAMDALTHEPADHVVIAAFEAPLVAQVSSLRDYLLSLAAEAPAPVLAEVDLLLGRAAAIQLTQGARLVADNLSTQTTKVAFRDLFEIIKKIIERILGLFGITLPGWILAFLEILDELMDLLASLGIFRLTHTMNQRHLDTMESLTKLAYLERAVAARERDKSGS